MKNQSLTKILTAFASALLVSAIATQPSNAQSTSTTFFCGTYEGKPTTIVRIREINIPIIPWNSSYFSDSAWTPERRCQEVSRRFQIYYQQGSLNYLTTREIGNMSIICAVETKRSSCQKLLFTLKLGLDPNLFLKRLFNHGAINEYLDRIYIDLDKHFNILLTEDSYLHRNNSSPRRNSSYSGNDMPSLFRVRNSNSPGNSSR